MGTANHDPVNEARWAVVVRIATGPGNKADIFDAPDWLADAELCRGHEQLRSL
jgi:hypothetical protein